MSDTRVRNGDGYEVVFRQDNGNLATRRYDGGSVTELDSAMTDPYPTGEWLVAELEYGFKTLTPSIYTLDGTEVGAMSPVTDTNYGAGYLQHQMVDQDSNNSVYLDYPPARFSKNSAPKGSGRDEL